MGKFLVWPVRLLAVPLRPLLARQVDALVRRNSRGARPRGPRRGKVHAPGESVSVLLIGDSTVGGSDIPSYALSLGGRLAEALSARTRRAVEWAVLSAPGLTPAKALEKYANKIERYGPDVVVIGLGGNSLVQYCTPGVWEETLASLVDGARARATDAPVVVTSMPPVWGMKAMPQPLRTHLALRNRPFNSAIRRVARGRAGVFVGPSYPSGGRDFFGPDGCHPSAKGYTLWGARLAETVAPLLPDESAKRTRGRENESAALYTSQSFGA
jgi:lysophospholipase L1-like esterase